MKYIICGLDRIGLMVAKALIDLKEDVTIITKNKDESDLFVIRDSISSYIEGDARSREILKLAGIDQADYFLIFTNNENRNIEINCRAKEIRPDIKTALLIKNVSYAKIIEQGFDANCVFHIPSIVTLPIVSACINKNILHTIKTRENDYFLGSIDCDEHPYLFNKTIGEIENTYHVKIINHFKPGEEFSYSSTSDDNVVMGGSLLYLATEELNFNNIHDVKSGINFDQMISETTKHFDFFKGLVIPAGIRRVIALYAILILLSTIIFKIYLGLSVINAVYFVITTTSTVGYGDFNLQNAPFWMKIYGCVIMLAGAALLATLFSAITDNIISKRLGGYVNLYNKKFKDHVIVAGIGSIGLGVVKKLHQMRIKTIVIEKNPDSPNIAGLRNTLPLLLGDASEAKVLLKAGIKEAKTLVALIDDDLNNINIILKGNSLNSQLNTVARIFSNELNKKAKDTFHIDNVISAASIAVPHIICSLIHKHIIWAGYFDNSIYAFFKLESPQHLFNKNKNHLLETFGLHPVLIERNGSVLPVDNETTFIEQDQIFIFSEYQTIKNFFNGNY
jgi:Trk K+ transport system NAD-binding subunit